MKTVGFQKKYTTGTEFVIVEIFEDGTSREGIDPENYDLYKNWEGEIPAIPGSTFVTIAVDGTVTYDSAGAAAAATAAAWTQVRAQRDGLIREILWRAERYERQVAVGLTPNDKEVKYQEILTYIQELRDITKQGNPAEITWPVIPE